MIFFAKFKIVIPFLIKNLILFILIYGKDKGYYSKDEVLNGEAELEFKDNSRNYAIKNLFEESFCKEVVNFIEVISSQKSLRGIKMIRKD